MGTRTRRGGDGDRSARAVPCIQDLSEPKPGCCTRYTRNPRSGPPPASPIPLSKKSYSSQRTEAISGVRSVFVEGTRSHLRGSTLPFSHFIQDPWKPWSKPSTGAQPSGCKERKGRKGEMVSEPLLASSTPAADTQPRGSLTPAAGTSSVSMGWPHPCARYTKMLNRLALGHRPRSPLSPGVISFSFWLHSGHLQPRTPH